MKLRSFYPLTFAEEIEKAIRFIKVNQFHAGFPEISSPERGGEIEVSIEPDEKNDNIFHIMFKYVTHPGRQTIIREYKEISYSELRRLAKEYDKNKDDIDSELANRHTHRLGMSGN